MSRKFNLLQKAIAFSWVAIQVAPSYAAAQQPPNPTAPPAAVIASMVPTTPIEMQSLPGTQVSIPAIPGGAVVDTTPPVAPPALPSLPPVEPLNIIPGTVIDMTPPVAPPAVAPTGSAPAPAAPAADKPAVAPNSTDADARTTNNPPPAVANNYMSRDEAKATFKKFEVKLEGNKVVMSGVFFRDCLAKSDFAITPLTGEQSGKPGLIMRDTNGEFRKCMAEHDKARHTCQTPNQSCQSIGDLLTDQPGIPETEDSSVYFFQPDPYSTDLNYNSGWKEDKIGDYEGTKSRIAKAENAENERVEALIDAERRTLESCRQGHDLESIGYAYEAIENLLAAGDLDEDAAERKRKAVATEELRVLKEHATSEECHEHLGDIRSDARDLAARSPELRDKIANEVYHELAKCALKETDEKELKDSDFAKAEEILKEAGKLGRLSKQTKESLARDRDDLKRGKKEFAKQNRQMLMQQGSAGSRDFRKAQSQAWKSLQQDYKTCSRGARTMEMAMMCQSLPQEVGQWHQMNQMHNQVLQREYQQQWLGYNGMGMNGQMGMGGQFSGPFGGNQNFGGGMHMPGGPNPLSSNFAPQQPQTMAGGTPQGPPQNYPSNLWQGGAYGGGANPSLNY